MSDATLDFKTRLRRINRRHARLERGYIGKIRSDGLIVFEPLRRRLTIPLRGLVYLVLGFAFFKAVVVAHLGGVTYEARVAQLAEGHVLERAGAAIMRPDPVSGWMAGYLARVLR